MPLYEEPFYCHEQIDIPVELPDILKQFTKSAIRTQPKDILHWSAAYFTALANGDIPPVKQRYEIPIATQKTDTGLTPNIIKALNRQLGYKEFVDIRELEVRWRAFSLPMELFQEICRIGHFVCEANWHQFLALLCSHLNEDIATSMIAICEQFTMDPEGGANSMNFDIWCKLYRFLAKLDGEIACTCIDRVIDYLAYEAVKQNGMIMPRNFMHRDCPPLYPEQEKFFPP